MKKFGIKLILFLSIAFILDRIIGFSLAQLQQHAVGGETARSNYINDRMVANIVFLGSSRCQYHYDPKIFEQILGFSAYNAGTSGNGIILMYPRFKLITNRYSPKVIIYELTEEYDLLIGDNEKYLRWLRPFYDRKGIDSIFTDVDPITNLKMHSKLFQYNSFPFLFFSDFLNPKSSNIKGFSPLIGELSYNPEYISKTNVQYDSLKLRYLTQLIHDCEKKSIKLFFSISPRYNANNIGNYKPIIDIAQKREVPILNFETDTSFIHRKELFFDKMHLNALGAKIYSEKVAIEIKKLYK